MTVAEVIILIIGAILFTLSFFIPDRGSNVELNEASEEAARNAVRDAVDEEIKRVKISIDEATEETIADNKDKMERYMDRLTNEKMMAVNEYSDTVLEQIHKDHQEAVFLYDMIDSKYSQVKSAAAEINQLEKNVRRLSSEIPATPAVALAQAPKEQPVQTTVKPAQVTEPVKAKAEPKPEAVKVEESVKEEPVKETPVKEAPAKKPAPKKEKPAKNFEPIEAKIIEAPAEDTDAAGIELMFDSDSNSMNNNDRILALHKEGKSNMAIAKELGLGVGEVKLVIDLFKSY